MNVGERIKEIRSNRKLSRRAFGEKLGVSESVIVNIEYNRLKKPEQQEPLYRLICSTFGISYEWLMIGKGSADQNARKTALNQLIEERDLDDIDRRILECYIELSESERDNFKQLLKKVAAAVTAGDLNPLPKIIREERPLHPAARGGTETDAVITPEQEKDYGKRLSELPEDSDF